MIHGPYNIKLLYVHFVTFSTNCNVQDQRTDILKQYVVQGNLYNSAAVGHMCEETALENEA